MVNNNNFTFSFEFLTYPTSFEEGGETKVGDLTDFNEVLEHDLIYGDDLQESNSDETLSELSAEFFKKIGPESSNKSDNSLKRPYEGQIVKSVKKQRLETKKDINSITFLPLEIFLKIFNYLNDQDIYQLAFVSRKFTELTRDASIQARFLQNRLFAYDQSRPNFETLVHLTSQCGLQIKSLSFLDDLTSEQQVQIIKNCPNLEVLSLYASNITNEEFTKLISELPRLTSLYLTLCNQITDEGIQTLRLHLPELQWIDIQNCEKVTKEGIKAIGSLTSLKGLELSCHLLADEDLKGILSSLTQLTALQLNKGYNLTDEGLKDIASLTLLQTLWLRDCEQLTDDGLNSIALSFPNLQNLRLKKCHSLTSRGCLKIAFQSTTLKIFQISKCLQITEETISLVK